MIDTLLVATSAIMKKCQLVNFRERFANLELCIYACKHEHISKKLLCRNLELYKHEHVSKNYYAETYTKRIMQMFTQ